MKQLNAIFIGIGFILLAIISPLSFTDMDYVAAQKYSQHHQQNQQNIQTILVKNSPESNYCDYSEAEIAALGVDDSTQLVKNNFFVQGLPQPLPSRNRGTPYSGRSRGGSCPPNKILRAPSGIILHAIHEHMDYQLTVHQDRIIQF